MEKASIYTSINVSTVFSYPSTGVLQWTPDGQLCILTRPAIHLMTPEPGINFDASIVVSEAGLGWLKTMISMDKASATKWPEKSQHFASMSLGALDLSVLNVAFSPNNITPDGGCVLAVLSSNLDVTLWAPVKNSITGEWIEVAHVTSVLLERGMDLGSILSSQTTAIVWTSDTTFGVSPVPITSSSFLVCGNRSGSLMFLRYTHQAGVQFATKVDVSESWITQLACSSAFVPSPSAAGQLLAYATSDGAVGIVRINQTFEPAESLTSFGTGQKVIVDFTEADTFMTADRRAVTSLKWIEGPDSHTRVLFCHKPGVVYLFSEEVSDSNVTWTGRRQLVIKLQKISNNASPFSSVSGVQYSRFRDEIIVGLSDGQVHVISNVFTDPQWSQDLSQAVSRALRSVFVQAHPERVDGRDLSRVFGFTTYDGDGILITAYEMDRPADFSYKHDAKHTNFLVVSQSRDDDPTDDSLMQLVSTAVSDNQPATPSSARNTLRSPFFYLRKRATLDRCYERLLEILRHPSEDHSLTISFTLWTEKMTLEAEAEFRDSLYRHLFGWRSLLALRTRLSIADYCWKLLEYTTEKQAEIGNIAAQVLNVVSHRNLRTIIRHISAVLTSLTAEDVPFVLRLVVQSKLSGSPEGLSMEGGELYDAIRMHLPDSVSNNLNETCPACQSDVSFQDITSAVCTNNHHWPRCSITTFILSSPRVRTCIGCTRKAFVPFDSDDALNHEIGSPSVLKGWFVHQLLKSVNRCLFCGNSFVRLL